MAQEGKQKTESKPSRCLPEDTRQHLREAHAQLRKSFLSIFPPAFIEHRRAARREVLLAARSLIDSALDHLKEAEKA
jgi:hypothetical protein